MPVKPVIVYTKGTFQNSNNEKKIFQGFIAALKDGYGFIETLALDREMFFHFRSESYVLKDDAFSFSIFFSIC